jgi:23S rRNA pseudouridine1911/1915/1917 synthase
VEIVRGCRCRAAGRVSGGERLPDLSRSRIQTLIREQYIIVNGEPAKPRDAVARRRPQHRAPRSRARRGRAAGHPARHPVRRRAPRGPRQGIRHRRPPRSRQSRRHLVNALLHHCKGKLSGIGGVERPGIVHRLDKDTSGCLVVAKNDAAHQSLVTQFSERTMEKLYLAVTHGIPSPGPGTVFTHIGRHPVNRQKMAVVNPPGGKTAITDYEVLATDRRDGTALVLCHLHTGRTHQIRVHMHHKGTPLLGDPIYGKPVKNPNRGRFAIRRKTSPNAHAGAKTPQPTIMPVPMMRMMPVGKAKGLPIPVPVNIAISKRPK